MSGGVLSGQSGGGISDGDKGDITVSSSGETWTVDNDVITLAKLADIATARMLGRVTAGSGTPEELTGTQVTALLDEVSTSAKGLVPTAPNDATKYLDGTGAWSVPPDTDSALVTDNAIPVGNGTTQVASNITDDGNTVTIAVDTDLTAGETTLGAVTHNTIAATLSAHTADWAPTGLDTARTIAVTATGGFQLQGLTGGWDGRQIRILNDGTTTFYVVNSSSGGTASNRFRTNAGTLLMESGDYVDLVYSAAQARWQVGAKCGRYQGSGLFQGTLTAYSAFNAYGPITLGDASDDAINVLGSPTFNADITLGATTKLNDSASDGTSGQVLTVDGSGYPRWTTPSDNALVTDNAIPVGDGSSQIASLLTDDGTTVTNAGDTDLSAGTTTVGALGGKVQTVSTTGNINDLALNDDTTVLKFDGNGIVSILGLTGGVDGRIVYILNANTTTAARVALGHEQATSTAENRIINATNISSIYVDQGSLGLLIYDGGASRWRNIGQREFYQVTTASTLSSSNGIIANAGGITSTGATIYSNMNAGSPASSAIEARSNGSVGGFIALTPLGLDDNHLTFDADYISSTWTAQDTSWASISKNGDKLKIFGATGATNGSSIASAYTSGLASPAIEVDLSDSLVTVNNALFVGGVAEFGDTVSISEVTSDIGFDESVTVAGTLKVHGVLDLSGTDSVTGGAILIGRQIFTTAGAFTYTPTSGTYKVRIRLVGGGGGGGATDDKAASTAHSAASGGASGAYLEHWIDPGAAITDGAGNVGAGGIGAPAGSVSGHSSSSGGGDSTIVVNGVTYTAHGGLGGYGIMSSGTSPQIIQGGAGAGASASSGTPDIAVDGRDGMYAIRVSGTFAIAGKGGDSVLGKGGYPRHDVGAGYSGKKYGGGGAGGYATSATSQAGGDGADGVVIVEEYR